MSFIRSFFPLAFPTRVITRITLRSDKSALLDYDDRVIAAEDNYRASRRHS